ncbi:MAG: hypothetical protein ACHBN1_37915 [Heteroscytonema crispum UTEX LB 1556]
MLKHKLSTSLMVINALVALSMSSAAFASPPGTQPGCPDGWVPAPNPQLGCIPNKMTAEQPPQLNRRINNPTPSSQIQFPPEIPQEFRYFNKCELGVVDSVDCPENNPIPAPRD